MYKKINKKNIILNDFITYDKIVIFYPRIKIFNAYERKVGVLIDNLNVSSYISPLKLFDYLASGLQLSPRKKAYSHILKHQFNCFLVQSDDIKEWVKTIKKVLSMPSYTKNSKIQSKPL